MGIALYRKYRPQTFADITGQNHIRTTLQNELAGATVAHAYVFMGPRGVGKTSLARIFAKALNCLDRKEGESEPCNACAACVEQTGNRSLDVIEVDAASNTGVDNVRENIIEHVRFAPTSRRYKVFIIDEAHMLSTSAWNALLKTLEEPPAHAIFILATTEVHKIPATIISRCQRFDFKRIPAASMVERLKRLAVGEGVGVADDVLAAIVRLSDGCLRDAESLLEQVLSLGEKNINMEQATLVLPRSNSELVELFVDTLADRRGAEAVALINRLVEEGIDLPQFTGETLEYLRGLLLAALGAPSGLKMSDSAKRLSASHLVRLINSLSVARSELKSASIPQLPLELVAAEHCGDSSASVVAGSEATRPAPAPIRPVEARPAPAPAPEAPKPLPPKQSAPAPVAPPEKTEKAPEPPAAAPKSGFSEIPIDTLALRWDELCAVVQEENPSLPFLLRVSRPMRFEDGFLVIGVQYKLHADKLNLEKNRSSIMNGLTALYNGANIPVRTIICAVETLPSAPDPLASSLLQQFGGTVVE